MACCSGVIHRNSLAEDVLFADRISALLNGRARHEIKRTTDFPGQFFAQATQIKKRNRSVRAEGDQNVQVALIESVAARTEAKTSSRSISGCCRPKALSLGRSSPSAFGTLGGRGFMT